MPSSAAAAISSRAQPSSTAARITSTASAPMRPCLDDLVRIQQEVLAQGRQRHRAPGRRQVGIVALEIGRVGQHRKAGRAARGIGAGQRRRVEVGADQALRRRRPLDLGDQGRPRLRRCLPRAPGEMPRGGEAAAAAARSCTRRSVDGFANATARACGDATMRARLPLADALEHAHGRAAEGAPRLMPPRW